MRGGINLDLKDTPRRNTSAMSRVEDFLRRHPSGCQVKAIATELTDLTERQVGVALNNLAKIRRAHCIAINGRKFLWKAGLAPIGQSSKPTRHSTSAGDYVPSQWTNEIARPEGEHHKRYGSLQADGSVKPLRRAEVRLHRRPERPFEHRERPMTRRGPSRPDHKPWTPEDDRTMLALFSNTHNQVIADLLGRTEPAISNRAVKLGLHKSKAYIAANNTHFKPGFKPWNTGVSYQAGGRSAETRFKVGQMSGAAQRNYKPIGSLRINHDGYLERKVTDDHPVPARRWVGVHRLVWEAANGPVPEGHVVRFKHGMQTNREDEITVDRLECISLSENMLRNSNWKNYPPEVARLVQLKGAITRQVNRITKQKESA